MKSKIKGITIVPKPKSISKPKKKPSTMVIREDEINHSYAKLNISAEDQFWKDWDEHHFDIGVCLAFVRSLPTLNIGEEYRVTDGKSVIIVRRSAEYEGVLLGGFSFKRIYSQEWLEKEGYIWTPHRKVYVALDHKSHFADRYKKRRFNLALLAVFIGRVPTTALGQRIKIIGENDILIGTRTSMHASLLITGMKRGEIDFEDYVDSRF
jgi:hypothetical protein